MATQIHSVPELKTPSDKSGKLAVLVVHGIGQQNPYETLDSFARGLARYYREEAHAAPTLRPERIQYSHAPAMCVHLEPKSASSSWKDISLFEYYWAPETEDKITYSGSLMFLLGTGIRPLRNLSTNLQEILNAAHKPSWLKVMGMFVREIYRAVLIFLPLIFALAALAWWLAHPPSLNTAQAAVRAFLNAKPWWAMAGFAVCSVMTLVMAIFLLQQVLSWLSRQGPSIEKWAEISWFVLAGSFFLIFLVTGTFLFRYNDSITNSVTALVWNPKTMSTLLALLAAYILKRILTGFVGDIAVYVTADEKSKNYAARKAILKGSCEIMTDLLLSDEYNKVIIVGHSLGSVIAYDTINKLIGTVSTRCAGKSEPGQLNQEHLAKLAGLVTFGSPLDKIYYFFREHIGKDQAIRAQLLSYIHPFRRIKSGRDYGDYKFPEYKVPPMPLRWVNVWSPLDPVSGNLDFYDLDLQRRFWYWRPGFCHLSYWRDRHFYQLLAAELIDHKDLRNATAAPVTRGA